jgi:phytoene dehydrogenase-like protein
LARAGYEVTVVERKGVAGGACCAATKVIDGISYEYPQGASVLGMMQDFVFEETGLAKNVQIHAPSHPSIFYSKDGIAGLQYEDPERFAAEMREKYGETGRAKQFLSDMERVVVFLRQGYRDAVVPTVGSAQDGLGAELTARWITGSARELLDHYFTSEEAKILFGISVVESGPVSFDSPYSAFTIPLMNSGSIFGGAWGYVQGGIWKIPLALDAINAELGVKRIFHTQVNGLDDEHVRDADQVMFATDPLTAARIAGEKGIEKKISQQKALGSGGKLVMLFRGSVKWKGDTGMPEFDYALRDLPQVSTLDEFEQRAQSAATGADFAAGNIEIYSEGLADRAMGGSRPYDIVSVYLGALGARKAGADLPQIKKQISDLVLQRIENPEDLIDTILETPRDLMNWFFFPGGNIDHMELAEGQTFVTRTYSSDPEKSFYRFGSNPNMFYCGAGSYPCGSVAGTNGYMCAKQIIATQR